MFIHDRSFEIYKVNCHTISRYRWNIKMLFNLVVVDENMGSFFIFEDMIRKLPNVNKYIGAKLCQQKPND